MKIAMAQMSMSASLTQNLEKALTLLTQAKQAEADLIVYPELTLPPPSFPSMKSGMRRLFSLLRVARRSRHFKPPAGSMRSMQSPTFIFWRQTGGAATPVS